MVTGPATSIQISSQWDSDIWLTWDVKDCWSANIKDKLGCLKNDRDCNCKCLKNVTSLAPHLSGDARMQGWECLVLTSGGSQPDDAEDCAAIPCNVRNVRNVQEPCVPQACNNGTEKNYWTGCCWMIFQNNPSQCTPKLRHRLSIVNS